MFDELLLCENIAGVFVFLLKFFLILLGDISKNAGKFLVERSSQDFTIGGTKQNPTGQIYKQVLYLVHRKR